MADAPVPNSAPELYRMAFLCPISRRRLAGRLKVFNEIGEMVGEYDAGDQFVDGLQSKLYIGVGSRSRITHLIRVEPDARTMAGALPRPPRTCTQENLDGWRCWAHTGVAHTWTLNTEHVASATLPAGSAKR